MVTCFTNGYTLARQEVDRSLDPWINSLGRLTQTIWSLSFLSLHWTADLGMGFFFLLFRPILRLNVPFYCFILRVQFHLHACVVFICLICFDVPYTTIILFYFCFPLCALTYLLFTNLSYLLKSTENSKKKKESSRQVHFLSYYVFWYE